MNLYRVPYVYRPGETASVQEKVAFVVADSEVQAVEHVNKTKGHEAQGASVATPNVQIASKGKA